MLTLNATVSFTRDEKATTLSQFASLWRWSASRMSHSSLTGGLPKNQAGQPFMFQKYGDIVMGARIDGVLLVLSIVPEYHHQM
jgi:hypothetical protein